MLVYGSLFHNKSEDRTSLFVEQQPTNKKAFEVLWHFLLAKAWAATQL